MAAPQAPAGRYSVIIIGASVFRFTASPALAITLEMSVTSGGHSHKRCRKRLIFNMEDLGIAKSRFNRLGTTLTSWDSIEDDTKTLVGAQLTVSVYYNELEQQKVKIHDYIGRGNAEKYI